MTRPRWMQLAFLVLAAGAVAAGMQFRRPMDASRHELDVNTGNLESSGHPQLKLYQALPGGLRAFAIDYLWIRLHTLKQEGKTYDQRPLAELICDLQPRFPGVWGYRAWDMAWNLSTNAHTPEERWRWISSAIELLRDKGIVYNPGTIELYQELARIYFDKIGGRMDEMHNYYKFVLAGEFQRLLGAPPRLGDKEEAVAWFRPVAAAPDSLKGLTADEKAATFVSELAECGIQVNQGLLDAYNAWSDDEQARMIGQPRLTPKDQREEKLHTLMTDPARAEARAKTVAFVRKSILVSKYRMKPDWMLALTDRYGPLDWRLPWNHAVYWSSYGVHHCNNLPVYDINSLNTDRFLLNSLKGLVTSGRAIVLYNAEDPMIPEVIYLPDFRFIDTVNREHEWMAEHIESVEPERTAGLLQGGHENFVSDCVKNLWFGGNDKRARELMSYDWNKYHSDPIWQADPERFVYKRLDIEGTPSKPTVEAWINSSLVNAYVTRMAGYDQDYQALLGRAAMFHKQFNDLAPARNQLAPFTSMQAAMAGVFISGFPVVAGSDLYRGLPLEVQQESYDLFAGPAQEKCLKDGLDFAKVFPEPPGIEKIRQARLVANPLPATKEPTPTTGPRGTPIPPGGRSGIPPRPIPPGGRSGIPPVPPQQP